MFIRVEEAEEYFYLEGEDVLFRLEEAFWDPTLPASDGFAPEGEVSSAWTPGGAIAQGFVSEEATSGAWAPEVGVAPGFEEEGA